MVSFPAPSLAAKFLDLLFELPEARIHLRPDVSAESINRLVKSNLYM